MVAATLALLVSTFGLAASRFDVRRGSFIEEANAIGTTFLRGGLLPTPHRTEVRAMILRASVRRLRSHLIRPRLLRSIRPKRANHCRRRTFRKTWGLM